MRRVTADMLNTRVPNFNFVAFNNLLTKLSHSDKFVINMKSVKVINRKFGPLTFLKRAVGCRK